MRRIYARFPYFVLAFFLVLFNYSCKSDDPDVQLLEAYLGIDIKAIIFGPDGSISITYTSNDFVTIGAGEEIAFEIDLTEHKIYTDGTTQESPYTGPTESVFSADGVEQLIFAGNSFTAILESLGTYTLTITADGTVTSEGIVIEPAVVTFPGFLTVEEKPVEMYYLAGEVFDNGQSAEYLVNDSHRLERVNYSLNDDLVEFHLFEYDSEDRLETQLFYNALNELLGSRGLTYDDDSQVINDKTVDADDNIVLEVNINWENGFAIGGTYTQGDGSGQTTTLDLDFTYDGDNPFQIDYSFNNTRIAYEVYGFDQNENPYAGFGNIERFPNYLSRNNLTSRTTYDANDIVQELLERGIIYDADSGNLPIQITETIDGMNPIIIDLTYNSYTQ